MDLAAIDPLLYNVLFIVLDSCRVDTLQKANVPFIKSLGTIRRALTHADYTLPAHMAMFEGRLPTVESGPFLPLYTDAVRQLWRVSPKGFHETKPKSEIALPLTADNIVEGYRNLGYFTLGAAGLNYFTAGRPLHGMFDVFLDYYDIQEGLIDKRPLKRFALTHVAEIIAQLRGHDKWFLFVNAAETHYPYDVGKGYDASLVPLLQKMQRHLNLRHDPEPFTAEESATLHRLQIKAVEEVDKRLAALVKRLKKNRPILIVLTGDHGESFGEEFFNYPRCGHLHPSPEVLQVPLLIGSIEKP